MKEPTLALFSIAPLVFGLVLFFKQNWSAKSKEEMSSQKMSEVKNVGFYFMVMSVFGPFWQSLYKTTSN